VDSQFEKGKPMSRRNFHLFFIALSACTTSVVHAEDFSIRFANPYQPLKPAAAATDFTDNGSAFGVGNVASPLMAKPKFATSVSVQPTTWSMAMPKPWIGLHDDLRNELPHALSAREMLPSNPMSDSLMGIGTIPQIAGPSVAFPANSMIRDSANPVGRATYGLPVSLAPQIR
jgi:hypothetical protein